VELNTLKLDRGVFTISIDFELIWGTLDLFGPERFRKICELERSEVIDRLLNLFTEFNVSATWAVLGHLFLDQCEDHKGVMHPEIIRPRHAWCDKDWFAEDSGGSEDDKSIFLGRSLVEKIRDCKVEQEIGSHSFSHVIFGDAGCSRETAESEIVACIDAADALGVELRSFVFPRNSIGHLDVLRKNGFTCYRGAEPHWYENESVPEKVRRLARIWEVITATEPPVVLPEEITTGFWNIPGSMIYFPMHGFRRYIPISLRIRRAIKGLNAAARERRIFHLWFHPTNLADQMETMFDGLRAILEHASLMRERGEVEILPMRAIVAPRSAAMANVSSQKNISEMMTRKAG
jgi:peptidoglycan/xylan/chitin deacetylase (PgdA/CDA1 family)